MRLNRKWGTIIILSMIGAAYALIYGQIERYKMKVLPKKVIFHPGGDLANPVLYIRKLKYAEEYITYIEKDISNIDTIFNFPLRTLPGRDTIFILRYLPDSILVEFYHPDYHGKIYGFSTGYLHRALLHDSLPTPGR